MVVVSVSVCPAKLRGDLSKWLFEISPGVYVGSISVRVRDLLWARITETIGSGKAVMAFSAHREQKVKFYTTGTTWQPVDYDGIFLMKHMSSIKVADQEHQVNDNSYVVIDIETTGLDPIKNRITQIAGVLVKKGEIVEIFNEYILLEEEIDFPKNIQKLTGITRELLNQKGKRQSSVLEECREFIGKCPVVFHNANFDKKFLEKAFEAEKIDFHFGEVIDTLDIARKKVMGVPNYRLSTLAEYFHIPYESPHSAYNDVIATMHLLEKLNEI